MSPIRNASLSAATLAGTLASVLAIGGGSTALASAPSSAPAPARSATIIDCSGHAVAHPSSLILACGDADTALTALHWSHWGDARATARATEVLNLCTPDCAAGKDARFSVRVPAERARTVRGARRYTRLVVHAGAGRPRGVPATETWTPRAFR